MHSVTQLTGGVPWDGDRNKDIPVGAVGAQHGSVASGMWRKRDIPVGAVGAQHCSLAGGMCEDRAGSQHFALGNTLSSQDNMWAEGHHSQRHTFTDCQPHLPGWWPLVGKVWARVGAVSLKETC